MMPDAVPALGIAVAGGPLVPLEIRRREPGPRDVVIDIHFCGLCDCDVRAGRGEPEAARLPLVPGHQIVGVVAQTGAGATDLEPGARVGVGALVDSCGECAECRAGREQLCAGSVATYGAQDPRTGEYTHGGYSKRIVVDRDFVLRIPAALGLAAAASLLCAGPRAASLVGSVAETRQLLEFRAKRHVAPGFELVDAQGINEAWERMLAAEKQHGFVLDLATLGGND